jgi:hypothetical protein
MSYWACRSCLSYAQSFTRKVKEVEKKLDEVQKEVKENAKEIERVDKNVGDLKKELSTVKNQSQLDTTKFITAEEYREREARRANIVMHRVREPTADTAAERREADTIECRNILSAAGVAHVGEDIRTCRRIGERGPEPRPLVVIMKSETAKLAAMEAARNLRNSQYSDISIVPDLTPQQRQEEAALGKEAERKNREELTDDDKQKNLTWQVVGQRGAKKLIKSYTRQQQRGMGRPWTAQRGRPPPAVPQPMGRPELPRTELLPPPPQTRKRGREYRVACRDGVAENRATDSGEEEEEVMDEETSSPASKR